jgi:hypothetical protein
MTTDGHVSQKRQPKDRDQDKTRPKRQDKTIQTKEDKGKVRIRQEKGQDKDKTRQRLWWTRHGRQVRPFAYAIPKCFTGLVFGILIGTHCWCCEKRKFKIMSNKDNHKTRQSQHNTVTRKDNQRIRHDETRQDKGRADKTNNIKENKTKRNKTTQNKTRTRFKNHKTIARPYNRKTRQSIDKARQEKLKYKHTT